MSNGKTKTAKCNYEEKSTDEIIGKETELIIISNVQQSIATDYTKPLDVWIYGRNDLDYMEEGQNYVIKKPAEH